MAGASGLLSGCAMPGFPRLAGPAVMADADLLRGVLAESARLAARYEAAIGALPAEAERLTVVRDAHRAHADALLRALDTATAPADPSASAAPGGTVTLKTLAEDERAASGRAATACLGVLSHHAPLVGTIAAARATHAESLAGAQQ
ncbi:hypothetical protein Val02_27530 [Virgisporangium aliadipatigenens]|uniref:DUF4439 domain-containing protein n=2 Tax=Virgisporangium aliadipatigenens TaxID=741659 RepID=A0A8J4DR10_9ACTN|nr:hypothetical protein Val02_27530 [Virgisporangium aliadipatigenens]